MPEPGVAVVPETGLSERSCLVLRELSVTPRGSDEILVGDLSRGEFVALPALAEPILEAMRRGGSLGDIRAALGQDLGEDVDVVDFAEALLELGFVAAVDGVSLAAETDDALRTGGRVAAAVTRLLKPFFSRTAWICYALLLVADLVTVYGTAALRPKAADIYFLNDPFASVAIVSLTLLAEVYGHELAHWFAARREGLPARISVSRRWMLMVLETDLSTVRALPRRRRFGPLAAGAAWDTVVLSVLILLRVADHERWLHLPATVDHYCAALVLGVLGGILFQLLIFLRTDAYAVMVLGFDCVNLAEVSRLLIRRRLGRLRAAQRVSLAEADPVDLRVARWYYPLLVAGAILTAVFAVTVMAPAVWHLVAWIGHGVLRDRPGSFAFCEAIGAGLVCLMPYVVALGLFLRDHASLLRRGRRSSSELS